MDEHVFVFHIILRPKKLRIVEILLNKTLLFNTPSFPNYEKVPRAQNNNFGSEILLSGARKFDQKFLNEFCFLN